MEIAPEDMYDEIISASNILKKEAQNELGYISLIGSDISIKCQFYGTENLRSVNIVRSLDNGDIDEDYVTALSQYFSESYYVKLDVSDKHNPLSTFSYTRHMDVWPVVPHYFHATSDEFTTNEENNVNPSFAQLNKEIGSILHIKKAHEVNRKCPDKDDITLFTKVATSLLSNDDIFYKYDAHMGYNGFYIDNEKMTIGFDQYDDNHNQFIPNLKKEKFDNAINMLLENGFDLDQDWEIEYELCQE